MSDDLTHEPSEEELLAYLEQLRAADVTDIVAQCFSMLGTAAQAKIGRPDARTLIDGVAALLQATASGLQPALAERMRAGIQQLQLAQVQAERDLVTTAGQGGESVPEKPQQAAKPTPEPSGQPATEPPLTSRLWVPGSRP